MFANVDSNAVSYTMVSFSACVQQFCDWLLIKVNEDGSLSPLRR